MSDTVEVFEDANDQWRWRMKAGNHKVIATSGESFDSKSNALRAAERVTGITDIKVKES